MLIGRRALLNYGQSMSDRKHDKYLRISHRVRSPIRSANNCSNSMLCIMNQAYQKICDTIRSYQNLYNSYSYKNDPTNLRIGTEA